MTAEPRCDCCDLPVSMCGKAAEERILRQARADFDELLAAGCFPAAYAGSCAGCRERFEVGDPIRGHTGDGWLGPCCA